MNHRSTCKDGRKLQSQSLLLKSEFLTFNIILNNECEIMGGTLARAGDGQWVALMAGHGSQAQN